MVALEVAFFLTLGIEKGCFSMKKTSWSNNFLIDDWIGLKYINKSKKNGKAGLGWE